MALKYMNGVPTRYMIDRLKIEFDSKFHNLHFHNLYGKKDGKHILIWRTEYIQKKMNEFMNFAAGKGVKFGNYVPYEPPIAGQLEVLGVKS